MFEVSVMMTGLPLNGDWSLKQAKKKEKSLDIYRPPKIPDHKNKNVLF